LTSFEWISMNLKEGLRGLFLIKNNSFLVFRSKWHVLEVLVFSQRFDIWEFEFSECLQDWKSFSLSSDLLRRLLDRREKRSMYKERTPSPLLGFAAYLLSWTVEWAFDLVVIWAWLESHFESWLSIQFDFWLSSRSGHDLIVDWTRFNKINEIN